MPGGGQTVRMWNRSTQRFAACALVAVVLTGCGGSTASTESTSTTRLTVLPETTLPAFEPTEDSTPPDTVGTTVMSTTTTTSTVPVSQTTVVDTATVDSTAPDDTVVDSTAPDDTPSLGELTLSGSGIGGAQFGAEPDGVVTFMSSFLGEPTSDTGYVDPFTIGACSGTELRLVSWGSLTLTFGDVSRVVQGQRHFYAYSYGIEGQPASSPRGLATSSGVTVGSPLPELLLAFPNMVINPADEFTPPNFFVNDDFRGYLTGLADDSTVSVIFGGLGCSG